MANVIFLILLVYKHCEYHAFCTWQVYGLAQVVGPVQPMPPHCPQWAAVPVAVDPALVVVVVVVVCFVVVVVVVVDVACEVVEVLVVPPELPGK